MEKLDKKPSTRSAKGSASLAKNVFLFELEFVRMKVGRKLTNQLLEWNYSIAKSFSMNSQSDSELGLEVLVLDEESAKNFACFSSKILIYLRLPSQLYDQSSKDFLALFQANCHKESRHVHN